jgi:hypothetical protein
VPDPGGSGWNDAVASRTSRVCMSTGNRNFEGGFTC